MKGFIAVSIALLGLITMASFYIPNREVNNRLGTIAKEVNQLNVSWKAAEHNKFKNISQASLKVFAGLKHSNKPDAIPWKSHNVQDLPTDFDSRANWPNCQSIKNISDQSSCGSCWAFGAAEAMTDRLCISSNQQDQTVLAPEDLLECCATCGSGCDGGYLYPAWLFWKLAGLSSGGNYGNASVCKPYAFPPCAHHVTSDILAPCPAQIFPTPSCQRQCANGNKYYADKRFAASVYAVKGENDMATEIFKNGPIEGAFTVYEDFLTYKSGVYVHTTGNELGGHAIKIIGFGVDQTGQKYWLCANSWNDIWGDQGFFRIAKGSNECGIEASAMAGLAATD